MGVHIFNKETQNLNENSIQDSYAMYLHKFIEDNDESCTTQMIKNSVIMSYDEFKEYFILKVLGRSSEFTANMARNYQLLSFDNFAALNAPV